MVAIILMVANLSGCGVYMAANQPDKKNTDLFQVGTPRQSLITEFGTPVSSEIKDGKKIEVFRFIDGYSRGSKVGREIFHGAADVVTIGLWEFVATPTEAAFTGDEETYQVSYDDKDCIDSVVHLKTNG
jgi:hypothetical protein